MAGNEGVRLESKLLKAAKCKLVVGHRFVWEELVFRLEEAEHILVVVVVICRLEV